MTGDVNTVAELSNIKIRAKIPFVTEYFCAGIAVSPVEAYAPLIIDDHPKVEVVACEGPLPTLVTT